MERDLSAVSTPALVAKITTLAGHLNAAKARFLALVAELERRRGWAQWGVKSCAHWLNWKCGIGLGAAREKVRVASEANEAYLLNIALYGTASHVEQTVRGYRRALDAAELSREAVQQRAQSLWFHTEPDGSMMIRGRVPAEVGALFRRALEAAEDCLSIPKNVPAGTSLDPDDLHRSRKRRVEALATLAESFLASGPRDLYGADRQQIVVQAARRRPKDPDDPSGDPQGLEFA